MLVRKAELKDLQRIQELNNQLFELELANFDKYLIKDWPLSKEGKEYFENAKSFYKKMGFEEANSTFTKF